MQQLESLLCQQNGMCRDHLDKIWRDSEFLKILTEIDTDGRLKNKFHEIRDAVLGADYPDDIKVLKKYSIK